MFVRAILLAGLMILPGCVLPVHQFDSRPEEFEALPDDHGVVVFQSVVLDRRFNQYMSDWNAFRTSRIGGPPMKWLKKNQKPPFRYNVYPVHDALPGTLLWVGVLPEGNYLAEDFYASFNNGQVYGHMAQPVLDSHASFRIEPSRVTLLDTYLYKSFGQTFLQANAQSPHDLLALATEKFPEIMAAADTTNPIRFSADAVQDEDRGEAVEKISRFAGVSGLARRGPDGRIYRTGRLGQIYERLPGGQWRQIALSSFEPVEEFYASDNGEAVAIMLGGAIYYRPRAELPFELLDTGIGHVQSLGRLPDGRWIAAARRKFEDVGEYVFGKMKKGERFELEFLVSDSLHGKWTSLGNYPVERGYAGADFVDWHAYVGNPSSKGFVVDLRDGQERELPSGFSFLRRQGDTLLALEDSVLPGIWHSDNLGATWTKLARVDARGMPSLSRDGRVSLVGELHFSSPSLKWRHDGPTKGLLVSAPVWDKWLHREELPSGCSGWVEYMEIDDMRLMLCELDVFRQLPHTDHWAPENMRGLREEERAEAEGFAARKHSAR